MSRPSPESDEPRVYIGIPAEEADSIRGSAGTADDGDDADYVGGAALSLGDDD